MDTFMTMIVAFSKHTKLQFTIKWNECYILFTLPHTFLVPRNSNESQLK